MEQTRINLRHLCFFIFDLMLELRDQCQTTSIMPSPCKLVTSTLIIITPIYRLLWAAVCPIRKVIMRTLPEQNLLKIQNASLCTPALISHRCGVPPRARSAHYRIRWFCSGTVRIIAPQIRQTVAHNNRHTGAMIILVEVPGLHGDCIYGALCQWYLNSDFKANL